MVAATTNPYPPFRKILTRLTELSVLPLMAMGIRIRFWAAAVLLLLAMLAAPAHLALAGCGCDKPPPKPAAVIPSVAAPGMPVTFYDRKFAKNQKWEVSFTSGTTSVSTTAVVVKKRDITVSSGKKMAPQLIVTVPKLPPGPTSIRISRGKHVQLMIPANSFVVMGGLIGVSQQNNELELTNYASAVAEDGTLYLGVGGLNTVCDPMKFKSAMGDPLRFGDGDVLIFNGQGYFIDALNPSSHNHFFINPGNSTTSDQLTYERHSFQQYCIDHAPGGAKQIDPKDPNWHLDGTPHVDYSIVIFAINAHLDSGATLAPGPMSSQMKMETELGDGTGDWEPEPNHPED
jgi:hypothetical protein